MNSFNPSIDPIDEEAAALLDVLRSVPEPDPNAVQRGRAVFLEQAGALSQAVSPVEKRRHNWWNNLFPRKEPVKMTAFATILTALVLLFGGSGMTAYAAQSSLPDQPLYPVKLASEDLRSELAPNVQTRLNLQLEFANRRVQEMIDLVKAGQQPPEATQARWEQQINAALRLTAGLGEGQLENALVQIRETLRSQEQVLAQTQASGPGEGILLQAQNRVQTRLQFVDDGLADPQTFRNQVRQGQMQAQPTGQAPGNGPMSPNTEPPGNGSGAPGGYGPGPGACTDCTPAADGSGSQNPWTDETPIPGSGYGPGPGDGTCTDCTPAADGSGSQNPWTDETPIPGSGYGPGPGDGTCTDCTPAADGSGNQNPWTDETPIPGSGYGPGPGDGTCTDCTPAADGSGNQNPWTTGTPTPYSGYGPGPGDGTCINCTPDVEVSDSQNPYTTGTPTPYSGYGPGPGDGTTCTPVADGSGSQNPYTTGTPVPYSGYGPGPGPTPTPVISSGGTGGSEGGH
ncbi:MAG: DUF5667 domain-containing protein [Chloroflexi bacterium]|nr:DUF5667 domain-containing protein [Chloroflexota bacterium]